MRLLSLSVAIAVLVLLACGVGVANIVASREQIHAESARELTMVSRVVASHLEIGRASCRERVSSPV